MTAHLHTVRTEGCYRCELNASEAAVRFRVTGKDRLSDPWMVRLFDTPEEADAWLDQRAFVWPGPDGEPLMEEITTKG